MRGTLTKIMGAQPSRELEREAKLSLAQVQTLCSPAPQNGGADVDGESYSSCFDLRLFHLLQDPKTGRVLKEDVLREADVLFRCTFRQRTRVTIALNTAAGLISYSERRVDSALSSAPSFGTSMGISPRSVNVDWESVKEWLGVGLFPDSPWEEACPALFDVLQRDVSDAAPSASVARPGPPGSASQPDAPAFASMNWSKPKSSFSLWRFKLTAQCRLELAYIVASHVTGRVGDAMMRQSDVNHVNNAPTTNLARVPNGPKLQLKPERARPLSGWGEAVRKGDAVLCAVLLQLSRATPATAAATLETRVNYDAGAFASMQSAMHFAASNSYLDVAQVLYGAGCSFYERAEKGDENSMPASIIESRHDKTLCELGLPDEEALLEAAESNNAAEVAQLVKLGTSLCCTDAKGRSPLTLAALYVVAFQMTHHYSNLLRKCLHARACVCVCVRAFMRLCLRVRSCVRAFMRACA